MDTQENIPQQATTTRRTFLRFAGLSGAAALFNTALHGSEVRHEQLLDEYITVATGRVNDIEHIASEIPPQLENEKIPENNEWFRDANLIFEEGIQMYEDWRDENKSLPPLFYRKPDNYLTVEQTVAKVKANLAQTPIEGKSIYERMLFLGADAEMAIMDGLDQPYSSFVRGSTSGVSNVEQMVVIDPGTGLVKGLQKTSKEKFGDGFDVWSACNAGELKKEEHNLLIDKFHDWHDGAYKYVQSVREKSDEPISTSVLFAYFLFKNKGDILASAWDTSTWLKVSARNNIHNLEYAPDYAKADFLCDLFKDEFSPKMSANWVLDHVDSQDESLNFIGDPLQEYQWKDYMPPNRGGGFYHAWNIMALSLCMSDFLITRFVAEHVNIIVEDDGKTRKSEYGRERSRADMLVVKKAKKVASTANRYQVK